jgi:hypothetical protein
MARRSPQSAPSYRAKPCAWATRPPAHGGVMPRLVKMSLLKSDPGAKFAAWVREQRGKLVDFTAFQRDILPLIQGVPLSRLQKETGLSLRHVSLIRRGERVPHPRHWHAFVLASRGPLERG